MGHSPPARASAESGGGAACRLGQAAQRDLEGIVVSTGTRTGRVTGADGSVIGGQRSPVCDQIGLILRMIVHGDRSWLTLRLPGQQGLAQVGFGTRHMRLQGAQWPAQDDGRLFVAEFQVVAVGDGQLLGLGQAGYGGLHIDAQGLTALGRGVIDHIFS